jgi:hypothetical protein
VVRPALSGALYRATRATTHHSPKAQWKWADSVGSMTGMPAVLSATFDELVELTGGIPADIA